MILLAKRKICFPIFEFKKGTNEISHSVLKELDKNLYFQECLKTHEIILESNNITKGKSRLIKKKGKKNESS